MTLRAVIWLLPILSSSTVIDLSGSWEFTSKNGSVRGTGIVPGDIFSDLFRNNLIGDPLFGDNGIQQRWVALDDWTYQKIFRVDQIQNKNHLLVLEGVDTVSTVIFNGKPILHTKNQFRKYKASIELLQSSNLTIVFHSPLVYSAKKSDKYKKYHEHVLPPNCPHELQHGECHPNFIRKAQYSFSWDWGPSIPTMGLWKPARIVSFNEIYVHDVTWNVVYDNDWRIDVQIEATVAQPCMVSVKATFSQLNLNHQFLLMGETLMSFSIPIEVEVERWYPRGYGEQKMYNLELDIGGKTFHRKVAFRTVRLVEDFIDPKNEKKGRNFYFEINGIPVFLKGSNWIPISMFPSMDHSERLKFLLDSALEVGMNTLRVWGGGFYESEDFYNYADEKGLLIWQDLMFACALYPSDQKFITETQKEVEEQIMRLKKHPSIIIWAGNNENEIAIRSHWWKVVNYTEKSQVHDYKKLYGNLMKFDDPSRPRTWSSPSNGRESLEEGGVAQNPGDVRYGDIHFYNDFANLWRDDTFQTPRCASEYGVQSYPLNKTMIKWINETEFVYTSKQMVNRQHHIGGILSNLLMIFNHLPIPTQCESKSMADIHRCEYIGSERFMPRLAYFSQIHQAITYKTETFHYRRFRNQTTLDGLGNTMCAMYWQLNDVWAAPTWSSIDFELNWKMSHYYARNFFADIAVYSFPSSNDEDLKTFVINDKPEKLENISVIIEMYSWSSSFNPVYSEETKITVPGLSAAPVTPSKRLVRGVVDYIYVTRLVDENRNEIAPVDYLLPDFLFEINFERLGNVTVEAVQRINDTNYKLTIKSTALSPFTWVDIQGPYLGYFSDNGFTMVEPEKPILLTLHSPRSLKITDFSVCNLKDCFL